MPLARRGLALAILATVTVTAIAAIVASREDAHAAPFHAYKYGVWSRSKTAADAGPANATPADSRLIRASVPGASEWVRQDAGQICVTGDVPNTTTPHEVAPGFSCVQKDQLASSDGVLTLSVALPTSHGVQYSVIGITPDGTSAIHAKLHDGSTQAVPVSSNGFQIASTERIDSLAVTDSADQTNVVAIEDQQ